VRNLFQLLAYFDWLALPRTIVQTFAHANWSTARDKHGVPGVLMEAGASLIGTNTFPFFVPLDSPWGGADIEALLGSKGIRLWGLGFANGEMFFRVSRRQAAWAQYLMLKAGVPLLHQLPAAGPVGGHSAAQAGGLRKGSDSFERLVDSIDSLFS
jgi:hypothetical protein